MVQSNNTGASRVAKPIAELKPGWMSRIFGIESASLLACDAGWDGDNWARGDTFNFLYRSKRGKYFLLQDIRRWTILTAADAATMYQKLPEKLVNEAKALASIEIEPVPQARDEDEDDRSYRVVRNDKWEFSIWLDYKPVPRGWRHIGVSGAKRNCLEFINQVCVFGAPNPGVP